MLEGRWKRFSTVTPCRWSRRRIPSKVRLLWDRFPRTHPAHAQRPAYGKEAVRPGRKIAGKKVVVDVVDVDKHRLISENHAGDRDINREMIEGGWAWAYRQHLKEPYTTPYQTAEMYAGRSAWTLAADIRPTLVIQAGSKTSLSAAHRIPSSPET